MGAEVVAADLDDPESLKKAFAGAYGVFCRHQSSGSTSRREKEIAQAKNMAEAAKGGRREARHLVDARRHAQAVVP